MLPYFSAYTIKSGNTPKHLERYVTELSGWHNIREFDTIDQMAFLAKGMVGKNLPYKEFTS